MSHAHVVAFVAGSLLAVLLGVSALFRTIRVPATPDAARPMVAIEAIQTVAIGALVVIFLEALLAS